jgi:hypothetical protein
MGRFGQIGDDKGQKGINFVAKIGSIYKMKGTISS